MFKDSDLCAGLVLEPFNSFCADACLLRGSFFKKPGKGILIPPRMPLTSQTTESPTLPPRRTQSRFAKKNPPTYPEGLLKSDGRMSGVRIAHKGGMAVSPLGGFGSVEGREQCGRRRCGGHPSVTRRGSRPSWGRDCLHPSAAGG